MKLGTVILASAALIFSSCAEPEIIPPPVQKVDLEANFYGEVNGAEVEFTEYVLGYSNSSTKTKILLPTPPSKAVYYSKMSSTSLSTSIEVGLGNVLWDANMTNDPEIGPFNDFFPNNNLPVFANGGDDGFEVIFTDGFGTEWKSDENRMPTFMDVEFTGITSGSDESGDYSQFICNFECYAYNFDFSDSVKIENAVYQGWFKR